MPKREVKLDFAQGRHTIMNHNGFMVKKFDKETVYIVSRVHSYADLFEDLVKSNPLLKNEEDKEVLNREIDTVHVSACEHIQSILENNSIVFILDGEETFRMTGLNIRTENGEYSFEVAFKIQDFLISPLSIHIIDVLT